MVLWHWIFTYGFDSLSHSVQYSTTLRPLWNRSASFGGAKSSAMAEHSRRGEVPGTGVQEAKAQTDRSNRFLMLS